MGQNSRPPHRSIPDEQPEDRLLQVLGSIAGALDRMAAAQEAQAEATVLLARATAGEFDEAEEVPEPTKPGQGMGMGGG